MNASAHLIAGYTAYTTAAEIDAMTAADAPAITPATPTIALSVAESSYACGAGVGASIGITFTKGC